MLTAAQMGSHTSGQTPVCPANGREAQKLPVPWKHAVAGAEPMLSYPAIYTQKTYT